MRTAAIFSAAVLLLAGGCNAMPDGEPPAGDIVRNPTGELPPTGRRELLNRATTELGAALLQHAPGEPVAFHADAATAELAAAALDRACRLAGGKISTRSALQLHSALRNGRWHLELRRTGVLWERDL